MAACMFSPRRVVCAGAKTMGADAARSAAQQGTEGASLTAAWHSLFKGVSLVINYDFPQTTTSYIHRIGRTGARGARARR